MYMMTKHKLDELFEKKTTQFGLGLLAAAALIEVIGVSLTVAQILQLPRAQHLAVISLFASMALTAVIPPLVAYFVGEHASKVKLKPVVDHFNGVLLAFCAFWMWLVLTSVSASWQPPVPANWGISPDVIRFWPSIVAAIIAVALAFGYRETKSKHSIIHYRPFGIVFLAAVILWPAVGSLISVNSLVRDTQSVNEFAIALQPVVIATLAMITMFVASYFISKYREKTTFIRFVMAATLTTVGILGMSVAGQLLAYVQLDAPLIVLFASFAGLAIWTAYLKSVRMV